MQQLLVNAYNSNLQDLSAHRAALDAATGALLKEELLTGELGLGVRVDRAAAAHGPLSASTEPLLMALDTCLSLSRCRLSLSASPLTASLCCTLPASLPLLLLPLFLLLPASPFSPFPPLPAPAQSISLPAPRTPHPLLPGPELESILDSHPPVEPGEGEVQLVDPLDLAAMVPAMAGTP